jgi:hypothetical protein
VERARAFQLPARNHLPISREDQRVVERHPGPSRPPPYL